MSTQSRFEEGVTAYKSYISDPLIVTKPKNPYEYLTPEYKSWELGWDYAREKFECQDY